MTQLASNAPEPWTAETMQRIRASFQKTVSANILRISMPDVELRMRYKIERWRLPGPEARTARQILRRLGRLGALVPPRIAAACFSTIWNRWVTARRFQRRGLPCNRCVLGCPGHAEDSIEHYSRCAVVWAFAARVMQIDIQHEKRLAQD